MTYYVATPAGKHEGPFTIDELRMRGITPDTLVYNEQLGNWTKAALVPEIANCIFNAPQPQMPGMNNPGYQNFTPQYGMPTGGMPVAPKTWLAESILVTLLCCLPFGIVGNIKAASVDSLFRAGDYEGAQRASQAAGKWTKLGFFCGLAVAVIYFIIGIVAGFDSLRQ